nr:SKP1/ASK-interacting protein 16 [Tanacetum cinerariifolium]
MKDVFVSVKNDLDETLKQNELLKDRLLKASLAEDIKNLVITSCVEIKNKDLHDETERISKESKDVSNESKTTDADLSKLVTAQSLPKNEKDQLLKQIASLESKLESQDIRSCQKEYHELRNSYNALKLKFDFLNRKGGKPMFRKRMPPKRTSTSAAPAITQAAIRQLVADSVATALEAEAATMANTDNTNRST